MADIKKYARIEDGIVVTMVHRDPTKIFHPDVAKLYVVVPEDAELGKPVPVPPKPKRKK